MILLKCSRYNGNYYKNICNHFKYDTIDKTKKYVANGTVLSVVRYSSKTSLVYFNKIKIINMSTTDTDDKMFTHQCNIIPL